VRPDRNLAEQPDHLIHMVAFEHHPFDRIMRHSEAGRRTASSEVIGEMRDTGAVHAVIADHASERPHQDLRFVHRFQVQHITEGRNSGGHVAVLARENLPLGGTGCSDHVGGTSVSRSLAQAAANVYSERLGERYPRAFRETFDLLEEVWTVLREERSKLEGL